MRPRLLLVELRRLFSRRSVVLLLLGSVLATGAIAGGLVWNTRPVSSAELAQARQQAEAVTGRILAECREHPEEFAGPGATAADCERVAPAPKAERFLARTPLSLGQARDSSGLAVATIVLALMVLLGATFAGGDWSSGSLSNQLIFVPDRWRVWLGKAAAVFLVTLVVTAVVLAAFWLLLFVVARARGIDTDARVLSDIGWMVTRAALLAGMGGAGGFALTMVLRRTAGTLGVLFAVAVGGGFLLQALPIPGAGRWSPANNLLAWIKDGHQYSDPSLPCPPGQPCDIQATLTLQEAAAYLGVLLLVVLVASLLDFRRRDVP